MAIVRRGRMQGGMKSRNFRPISCYISGTIQDTAIATVYGIRIGNLIQAFEWYHFQ